MTSQEDLLGKITQAVSLLQQETLSASQLADVEEANALLWDLLDEQDGR